MARILFIDDDESIRFLVKEELAFDGHAVSLAADGVSGLNQVERERPDLVVVDLKMPGMGGLEVVRHLKARYPDLPVFVFTAYNDHAQDARALGADGYYVKSPDLTHLKQGIRKATASGTRSLSAAAPHATPPPRSG